MGRPPTSNFDGNASPVPPKSPPMRKRQMHVQCTHDVVVACKQDAKCEKIYQTTFWSTPRFRLKSCKH